MSILVRMGSLFVSVVLHEPDTLRKPEHDAMCLDLRPLELHVLRRLELVAGLL